MLWKRRARVGGLIHLYQLTDWWLTVFNPEERAFIESKYGAVLTQGSSGTVHRGGGQVQQAADFLIQLAGWFTRKDQVHLGLRILEKAREAKLEPTDLHFLLTRYIELRYKQRNDDREALGDVIHACESMIAIAPVVAAVFRRAYAGHETAVPPAHIGYAQLIIIRKKQKNLAEAKRLQREFNRVWR